MGYSIIRGNDMHKNIKELRELTGLSQSQFSKEFNIPIRTLQKWESGERIPPEYMEGLLKDSILYRGLANIAAFKEKKNMYKNIQLPEYETKTIDELSEYVINDWLKKYPNKTGIFLLNSEDPCKGKLIAQSSVRAFRQFASIHRDTYDNDPDIVVVKGSAYKTADEQLLALYGKHEEELSLIDIESWKKENPEYCALVIQTGDKNALFIAKYDISEKSKKWQETRNRLFYDDSRYTII